METKPLSLTFSLQPLLNNPILAFTLASLQRLNIDTPFRRHLVLSASGTCFPIVGLQLFFSPLWEYVPPEPCHLERFCSEKLAVKSSQRVFAACVCVCCFGAILRNYCSCSVLVFFPGFASHRPFTSTQNHLQKPSGPSPNHQRPAPVARRQLLHRAALGKEDATTWVSKLECHRKGKADENHELNMTQLNFFFLNQAYKRIREAP